MRRSTSAFGGKADMICSLGAFPLSTHLRHRLCPVKLLSQRIQYPPCAWGADMRRRDFIKVIGSTVAWPLAARAQAPGRGQQKVPTIGFLGGGTAASIWSSWAAAFVKRLAELGWVEHRTIAIEYRWAEGRSDRFAEIAAEFVRLKVDV